jgi:hypothetical protein
VAYTGTLTLTMKVSSLSVDISPKSTFVSLAFRCFTISHSYQVAKFVPCRTQGIEPTVKDVCDDEKDLKDFYVVADIIRVRFVFIHSSFYN